MLTRCFRRVVNENSHPGAGGHYAQYLHCNPSKITHIVEATKMAQDECKRLFREERWNCRSHNPNKPYGNIVEIGTVIPNLI